MFGLSRRDLSDTLMIIHSVAPATEGLAARPSRNHITARPLGASAWPEEALDKPKGKCPSFLSGASYFFGRRELTQAASIPLEIAQSRERDNTPIFH